MSTRVTALLVRKNMTKEELVIQQTFKWIGALWKISIIEIDVEHIELTALELNYSMIVCSVIPSEIPSAFWDNFLFLNEKEVPIVGFWLPGCLETALIEKIWGIITFDKYVMKDSATVRINQGHPYTKNLSMENLIDKSEKCNHVNLSLSKQSTKLIYNSSVILAASKGLNVFFGIDPNQLGMGSFKSFFVMIENIFFYNDLTPHLAPGGYTAVRVDDFPTCTSEYLHAWKNFNRAIKRIAMGILQLSPLIFFIQLITLCVCIFCLFLKVPHYKMVIYCLVGVIALSFLSQLIRLQKRFKGINQISFIKKLFWIGHDAQKILEFEKLRNLFFKFGAKLEYMVNSHILNNKDIIRVDKLMPKTIRQMVQAYTLHQININAHGRSHINESKYCKDGTVDVKEFIGLSEEETDKHIKDNINMLNVVFGKEAVGFVAPAWGYEENVTKKIAAKYFSYLVDNNPSFLETKMPLFGLCGEDSLLFAWETWLYGMPGINMADKKLWEPYVETGMPVHFLIHGTTIGEQKYPIAEIIRVGHDSGMRWLFLEELVMHMHNYHNIVLINNNENTNPLQLLIECKNDMSQEIIIVGKYSFSKVVVDNEFSLKIDKRVAWIPKLNKGRHVINYEYEAKSFY